MNLHQLTAFSHFPKISNPSISNTVLFFSSNVGCIMNMISFSVCKSSHLKKKKLSCHCLYQVLINVSFISLPTDSDLTNFSVCHFSFS
jgi:hypothetical protein